MGGDPFRKKSYDLELGISILQKVLSGNEKKFFLNSLEKYQDERIPLSTILHLLRAWAVHFENRYLLTRAFIKPYPRKLIKISVSGK
jgi:uncharacterized protein YbgA (DUF1722 family)